MTGGRTVAASGLDEMCRFTRACNDAIFEAVDRFYRAYYPCPKPILHIIKTMLEDKDVFIRRCREGYEFFKSLHQRKEDLAAARRVSSNAVTA